MHVYGLNISSLFILIKFKIINLNNLIVIGKGMIYKQKLFCYNDILLYQLLFILRAININLI